MTMLVLDRIGSSPKTYQPQLGYGLMSKRDKPEDDRFDPSFAGRIAHGIAAKTMILPESQIQEIADAAASNAIRKVLIGFGVDPEDAASMRAINEDFIELHRLRHARERWAWMIKAAFMTGFVSALGIAISYLWKLITLGFNQHSGP